MFNNHETFYLTIDIVHFWMFLFSDFVMFWISRVQFVPQSVVYKIAKDKFKLAFTEPQTPELIGVIFVGSDL